MIKRLTKAGLVRLIREEIKKEGFFGRMMGRELPAEQQTAVVQFAKKAIALLNKAEADPQAFAKIAQDDLVITLLRLVKSTGANVAEFINMARKEFWTNMPELAKAFKNVPANSDLGTAIAKDPKTTQSMKTLLSVLLNVVETQKEWHQENRARQSNVDARVMQRGSVSRATAGYLSPQQHQDYEKRRDIWGNY
jgi:hypothetical protein